MCRLCHPVDTRLISTLRQSLQSYLIHYGPVQYVYWCGEPRYSRFQMVIGGALGVSTCKTVAAYDEAADKLKGLQTWNNFKPK